ncbi:MAG: hypothetical protein AAB250_14225 [Bdellovibrionota bacterium]
MKKSQVCPKFRQFLVVALVMISGGALEARECFREHLREAIALNRERLPRYSSLSGGRSEAVSNRLILLERLALTGSHLTHDFDKLDKKYQKAGLQVLCEDFVPMDKTPAFKPQFDGPAPLLTSFRSLQPADIKARLKLALKNGGFLGVRIEAGLWLASISSEPRMNCMMRHTLASIARIATLAPLHAERAKSRGLPTPENLERRLIESHWALIDQIQWVDRKAAGLQAQGLPIVCNDVPPLAL